MDLFDPTTIFELLGQLWNLPGAVGPIMTVAAATVFLVNMARKQLTAWIPWLATRRGALTLVGIFAAVGTAVSAALQGETSLLQLVVQAVVAALTAVGMRSSTKAAKTGGAATIDGWEGTEPVTVLKHENVKPHPDQLELPFEDR